MRYISWVNKHPDKIEYYTGSRHRDEFHKPHLQTKFEIDKHIKSLKAIVNGRKMVLDKYKAAENVTPSEIDALEQKFKFIFHVIIGIGIERGGTLITQLPK